MTMPIWRRFGPKAQHPWAMTWRPLLVDAPAPGGGKQTVQLPCVFIYQLEP